MELRDCKKERRLGVSTPVYQVIQNIGAEYGVGNDLVLRYLVDFFYMRNLDTLIVKVRKMYDRGLTTLERNQLSVLYSLLAAIDKQIGLN